MLQPPVPHGGPAGDHVAASINGISRRIWIQRALTTLARGAWLGALVAVLWQALELLGGPKLNASMLPVIAVALFFPATVLALLSRPTRRQTALMLDRSFRLQQRIETALSNVGYSVPQPGERPTIDYLQIADAANALSVVKHDPAFRIRPPIREMVLAIICGLAFASLFFLRGGGGGVPLLDTRFVPEFVPAAQRFVSEPTVPEAPLPSNMGFSSIAEVQQLVESSNSARQDLQTLASALADHAFTRSVASSINQDDYLNAAQQLRDLSSSASGLSSAERSSLAADLESAASQMTGSNPQLIDAARSAAEGLQEGGSPAEQGIADLGDSVEQTAQSIASQSSLDEAMQQAQQAESANAQSSQDAGQSTSGQAQSLFAEQSLSSQSTGSESGLEQSTSESAGSAADAQSGLSEETGRQPVPPEGGQHEGSDVGDSGTFAGAQAPSEDVTGGGGDASYEEPELNVNPGGAQGQSDQADAGDGAGGSGSPEQSGSGGDIAQSASSETLPDPSEANPTSVDAADGEGSGPGDDPRQGVTLQRSPDGESLQVPGTSGRSSLGSGAGVSVSTGDGVQGDVGVAGPDRNHVPDAYRPIVESYFSEPD